MACFFLKTSDNYIRYVTAKLMPFLGQRVQIPGTPHLYAIIKKVPCLY